MVLTFAMFFVLGLILAVAGIVVATALDQGLRVLPDLRNRLGVPALAAIPDAGRIPRVTGIVAELPRRVTSTSERTVRRGRDSIVALQPERGVPRGLDVVDQPEPEPAQTHGPRRFGVSRPSSTTPVAGNSRRQGPIGHGRRGGID
jgi:hypothetical protein